MTELQISISGVEWDTAESADRDLISRAGHDRGAFALLYRQHYEAIAGHVFRRTGDAHVTDDIVAETFLAAMRSISRFRFRGIPFRAWLFRIATNKVNRWARKRRRDAVKSLESSGAVDAAASSATRESGHEADRARKAMWTLLPKHQAVLSLHYLEGMSLQEVASVIGCRVGTVKSRLARGRDALRERLTKWR
ncbi:MAG: RNA polymerase sigma factor [Planctomycetes bacterium]|nr:RNA polymerase sigma factor [Planctomycetota bacterium]